MSDAIKSLENLDSATDVEKVREIQRNLNMCKGNRIVDDKGEWIGNSAKDRFREGRLNEAIFEKLNPLERQKELTRDKIWPKPNYRALTLDPQPDGMPGMTPEAAMFIEGLRLSLTPKISGLSRSSLRPNEEEAQNLYFKGMNWFAENATKYQTELECMSMRSHFLRAMGLENLENTRNWAQHPRELSVFQLFIKRPKNSHKLYCPFSKAKSFILKNARDVYPYDGNMPECVKDWYIHKSSLNHFYAVNKNKALLLPKDIRAVFGANSTLEQIKKGMGDFRISPFGSKEEVVEWIKLEGQKIIGEYLNKDKKRQKTSSLKLLRGHIPPERTSSIKVPSVVNPAKMLKDFGLRAVEFGESMPDKERVENLKKAYGALVDLSESLSIPREAIGLNNSLALAFGSRGRSSSAAHYEHSREVINLTRRKGEGSLAHEWFHAFDHHLTKEFFPKHILNGAFLTEVISKTPEKVLLQPYENNAKEYETRKNLLDQMRKLQKSIFKAHPHSEMYKVALKQVLDYAKSEGIDLEHIEQLKKKHCEKQVSDYIRNIENAFQSKNAAGFKYWGSFVECFARVGEANIEQRLNDKSIKSTYLVAMTLEENQHLHRLPFNAYPEGEDRKVMFKEFNKVLNMALEPEMALRQKMDLENKKNPPKKDLEIDIPKEIPKKDQVKTPIQASFGF